MAIDLGTGDGRYVLARAAEDPDRLVVGIDANAAAMARASRRAEKRGLQNAVFLAADATALPPQLAGLADTLTIHFPWGLLLHAAARADESLTRLVRPGGCLRLLISASARDATSGLAGLQPALIANAYAARGFSVAEMRAAGLADAVAAHSSWGKRLLRSAAAERACWLFDLRADGRPC